MAGGTHPCLQQDLAQAMVSQHSVGQVVLLTSRVNLWGGGVMHVRATAQMPDGVTDEWQEDYTFILWARSIYGTGGVTAGWPHLTLLVKFP